MNTPVFHSRRPLTRRPLTRLERKHVRALLDRCAWLEAKIAELEGAGGAPPHRFRQELAALGWALAQLDDTEEDKRLLAALREAIAA